MEKTQYDIPNLCKKACEEFTALGFKKDIDPRTLKESFNIFKQQNGAWFKTTKSSLHDAPVLTPLDFDQMPALKTLSDIIDKLDSDFQKKGGRIFITENLIYKIKKGSESLILFNDNQTKDAINQKLCDEINEHGLLKDRYRAEETYMLTKASNGEWSMSASHENHSGTKIILDLAKMPHLKALAQKINKTDAQFQANGGRIFITLTRIYRIKNKIEIDLKFK